LSEDKLATAAARQRAWAEALLTREPELGLVVMGHTHRAATARTAAGEYLNPGAWFDGYRFAVATAQGVELRRFETPS
jgi:UDP-2,3-diacylglucosamine pyrophosphatase LpxH